jgi:hypothetical protein
MKRLRIPEAQAAMFSGLVGRVVDLFGPYTEASPVAIAVQFLIAMGNVIGLGPHVNVGETRHGLNENLLVCGTSSFSRKGDSWNSARRVIAAADPDWGKNCIASGLSSGEGLIHAVRDPVSTKDPKTGQLKVADPGVTDKRLLVVESEFSQPLKMFTRTGNILSDVIRNAWDGKPLRSLTKHSPTQTGSSHISIIGHTTPEDLHTYLSDGDIANGFGNRFLFALVDRIRFLPNPERVDDHRLSLLLQEVKDVIAFAHTVLELNRTPDAEALWESLYPDLTKEHSGLVGKLLARGPAHIIRLSALFALFAQHPAVATTDIESALAVWSYSKQSVEVLFEGRSGNPIIDRIREGLLPGREMTLNEIRREIFHGHVLAPDLSDALGEMRDSGEVEIEDLKTPGRSAVVVRRVSPAAGAESAKSAKRGSTPSPEPEAECTDSPDDAAEERTEAAEEDTAGSPDTEPLHPADPPTPHPDTVATGTSEVTLARLVHAALQCETCALRTLDVALVHLCCELKRDFTVTDGLGFLHRRNGREWRFIPVRDDPWATWGRSILPLPPETR